MADTILTVAFDLDTPVDDLALVHPVTGERLTPVAAGGKHYTVALANVLLPSPFPFKLWVAGSLVTALADILDLRPPVDPTALPFASITSAGVRNSSTKQLLRTLWGNESRPVGGIYPGWDNNDDAGQPVTTDPSQSEYVVQYSDATKPAVFSAIIGNSSAKALTSSIPTLQDDKGNNVVGSDVWFGFRPFNCISIGKKATRAFTGGGYTEGPQSHGAFDLNNIQVRLNYQKIPGADRITQGTCYQAQNDTLLFHLGYDGIDGISTGLSGTLPSYFHDYKSQWFLYAVRLDNPDQRVAFSAGTNYAVMQGERPQISYNGYQFSGRCTGLAASNKYVFVSLADTNEIIVLDAVTMAFVRSITTFVRPGALLLTREGTLRVAYQDPGTPDTTPVKLTGQPVGAAGYGEGFEFSIDKAFDGNPNTYYASSANITNGWLGLYVGPGVVMTSVNLRPSDGREADCMGWVQLSNANNLDDGRERRTVYQIANKPAAGQFTRYSFDNTRPWSYVRVFNPGKALKVAEMEVWGYRLTDTQVVANFAINGDGTLSESGPRLSGHQEVTAMSDDALGNLYTREGGNKQAVCRYSKANGGAATATWTQAEGVKFYFTDVYGTLLHNQESPAPLACAPDNSVWVGDTGNERLLHLSASGAFVEAIYYSSHSRSVVVDGNDPTCLLGENREYTLNVDTLASKLKFPWSQTYNSMIYRYLKEIATLSNGRRYAVVAPEEFPGQPMRSVVEMVTGVGVRFTPTILPQGTHLESDGSLLRVVYQAGQPTQAYRRLPTGFDASNNPQWGNEVAELVGPAPQAGDPHATNIRRFPSGAYVVQDASRVQAGGSPDYHVAGWQPGNNYFDFKTARATSLAENTGPYPLTGAFDTRENLQDPGGPLALLVDKTKNPLEWFVTCYMGEGWNGLQCCYFTVFDRRTGLVVCIFGSTAAANPPSMTSVVVGMSFVRLNADTALLIVNEEGGRGFPVWKLTGLATGNVIVKPVSVTGKDTRTAIDPATGPPAGLTYEPAFTVLSNMADPDGVIRIHNRFFGGPVSLNCGATPVEMWECIVLHGPTERGISGGENNHFTMRDCFVGGNTTAMDGNARPQSVYLYKPTYVDIHHITTETGGGIIIDHWNGTDSARCRITNLRSRNVIGKQGDFRHCVQLSNVHTSGLQLDYIESYNEPGKSRIEDTINMYNCGGTSTSAPFTGKGFYLHGSYPFPLTETYFSGAALSADGSGDPKETPSQFIALKDAWLVSNCGAAANIATGNNISYTNLHGATCGYLPDGTALRSSYRGFWIGDFYGLGAGSNNRMDQITTRFMRTKDVVRRADFVADPNDSKDVPNPGINVAAATLLPDVSTVADGLAQERALFLEWRDYLNKNGQTCGSRYKPLAS